MAVRRKPLVIVAAVVGVLLLALLLLPFLFEDRIAQRARGEIARAVNAKIDWRGTSLSFFRSFPHLTLGLEDLSVAGVDRFDGDTLAAMRSLRLVLDVGSVIGSVLRGRPVVVRSIRLVEPRLSLRVLEDGTANWDIVKPKEPAQAEESADRGMSVELRSLELSDGWVEYRSAPARVLARLEGLHHTLSGNFARDSLRVRTRTRAERATLEFAGTPWLPGVALDFEANVDADLIDRRFAFRENELRLNDLRVRFEGEAESRADSLRLNLAFRAPESGFGALLSLLPAIYERDFESLETSGSFALGGRVSGVVAENHVPAFELFANVSDGMFRYPDLPRAARAIALDIVVGNPGGTADSTTVSVRRFHAEIGERPIEGSLTLRTPVSDPQLEARVRGSLDLADLARTVKLENIDELTGLITVDASLAARRSDVENQRYDRVQAGGTIAAEDVAVRGEALRQPVNIEEARLSLSPQRAELQMFRARLGSSDVRATGAITNLPAFLMGGPLSGSATFTSHRFVLDEWRSGDTAREVIPVPENVDLTISATIDTLDYSTLRMANARGSVRMHDERLTLDGFTVDVLGGRMALSGYYETKDLARPTFAIALDIDSLDIRSAAESLITVRSLAPVAQYARGTFSADLDLSGALAQNLTPLLDVLSGSGSLLTSRIALEGFPPMQRLAEALKVPRLSNPTLHAIRSTIDIRDGRLFVRPFTVSLGDLAMEVSGSNGVDQSLDYNLQLMLPRSLLSESVDLVRDLALRAGQAGIPLSVRDTLRLGVRVAGTVTDPTVDLALGSAAGSIGQQAEQAAGEAVERRLGEAREQVDSARAEAVRRAQARADSIMRVAEEQADTMRARARRLADEVRAEGNRRAEEVLARAGNNELARRAAQPVADRLRREADEQANAMVREADERADALLTEARREADRIVREAGGG